MTFRSMTALLVDRSIRCPYCDESIMIIIDLSDGGQTYIEDCQVCCQPIQIGFETAEGELLDFKVEAGA